MAGSSSINAATPPTIIIVALVDVLIVLLIFAVGDGPRSSSNRRLKLAIPEILAGAKNPGANANPTVRGQH